MLESMAVGDLSKSLEQVASADVKCVGRSQPEEHLSSRPRLVLLMMNCSPLSLAPLSRAVFRTPLEAYHVLITLRQSANPRRALQLDAPEVVFLACDV